MLMAVAVVGCSDKDLMAPEYPGHDGGFHAVELTPRKTITIKRKKPTIENPSPRPLSVDYEEYYDEDNNRE